jgi:hypothetical protein
MRLNILLNIGHFDRTTSNPIGPSSRLKFVRVEFELGSKLKDELGIAQALIGDR